MVGLWNIAIGKMNPDGTPKKTSTVTTAESGIVKESSDGPKEESQTNVASVAGAATLAQDQNQPQSDDALAEEDADTKVYAEYGTEDDKQVIVSKRTRYRVWRQFENGTHSKHKYNLITIMPDSDKYTPFLKMIHAYNRDIGKGFGYSLINSYLFRSRPTIDSAYALWFRNMLLFRLNATLEYTGSFQKNLRQGRSKHNENNSYHFINKRYKENDSNNSDKTQMQQMIQIAHTDRKWQSSCRNQPSDCNMYHFVKNQIKANVKRGF